MKMELLKYLLLGLVQGIAEALPISSSGHLMIVKNLFNMNVDYDMIATITNFGSLLAVIVVFWSDIKELIVDFFKYLKTKNKIYKDNYNYCWMIVLGCIPAGIMGLVVKKLDLLESLETRGPKSYIDNLIPKIIENIININIGNIIEKINEEFIILNARYNNELQVNMRVVEILKIKFEKFFKPKIQKELYKIFLEKASLIFIKITKIFIGEKISENIQDKEINELANSNINNLLQKISIEYESDS